MRAPRPLPHWMTLLSITAVLACGSGASLRAAGSPADWTVNVWTTANGLAGNNVSSLARDDEGFLWMVAGGRIARFDGARIEDFGYGPAEEAVEPRIRGLKRARNGDLLWFNTEGVIGRAGGGKVTLYADGLPDDRAEALAEDADGGILIAFHNGTVRRRHGSGLTQLTARDGLPSGRTHMVFAHDRDGELWFAKAGAVGMFRHGRFETLVNLEDPNIRMSAARDGGLWICSGRQLLRFRAGHPLERLGEIPSVNRGTLASVLREDHRGAVWIGTSISGLVRYEAGRFEHIPISHRQVVSLEEDREGTLWVGTSGGGLNQVQRQTMQIEGRETGFPFPAVQAICEDPSGQIWAIAQDGSPVRREGEGWVQAFGPGAGFEGEATCIAADPSGAIWIGTKNQRLYRWHEGRLQSWGAEDGLPGVLQRTLHVSTRGEVWVGSARPATLLKFRDGGFERVPVPEAAESIWTITEDAAGQIWVGGGNGFIGRIGTDGKLATESARKEIGTLDDVIRTMYATSDGSIWLGYQRSGIARIKDGTLRRITTRQGLLDDNLRTIIGDRQGWLWFVAPNTISKVRRQELDAVAEGRSAAVQPVGYGRDQGIHVVLGGAMGAMLARDGRLWLPLATSLAIIQPEREEHRVEPPPVRITEVAVDDRILASHGGVMPAPAGEAVREAGLVLAPDHGRLSFGFTALTFSSPGNVRFRYRLDPFDSDWIEAGRQRQATYSRLRPGDYQFRVRASSGAGVWNEHGATLAFTVPPFWWETWWFRSAVLAAFTAGVFLVARFYSVRRLQRRLHAAEQEAAVERERARIARDIHDDLGGRLTKIALLSGLAARDQADPRRAGAHVREIQETARQLMQSLDETVWTVNPRNDSLPHLVSYVGQFAVNFLRTAEITCHLELPVDPPPVPVGAEVRHNLLMAVKEALTNVVRHACAREVRLRVELEPDRIAFVVEDDGRGFSGAVDAPGADGLRNMRQRMEQVGGIFHLDSRPGDGTRLTLGIPRGAIAVI